MTSATDAELIEGIRRGERASFGELVERCADTISAVSYAATRDRALSEDITQETFVTAWRELDRLRDPAALRPWLCKIARNLAHTARRKRKRELVIADPDELATEPPCDAHDSNVERTVAAALARVPEVYREALVMFYYDQRSAKQVAVALGVSENAVHKRLSRGRRYLAAGIEQLFAVELKPRRSRRELAACVLAILPITFSAARSEAAAKGPRMWKLVAVTAAITVGGVAALPSRSTRHTPAPITASVATTVTTQRSAPPPASIPMPREPRSDRPRVAAAATQSVGPVTCAAAARHMIAVALVGLETAAEQHTTNAQRVTARLETDCRDNAWSPRELACLIAADSVPALEKCRPSEPPSPPVVAPEPVGAGVDVSCEVVGGHVADLMIESLASVDPRNLAAAVIEDVEELPARVMTSCAVEQWSDSLRRCYAAADRFAQIVVCRLR